MRQCLNCGLSNNDNAKYCIRCGHELQTIPPINSITQAVTEQNTLSIGQYLKYLVLFFLPIAGWIITIVFICKKNTKQHIRNLATACLLFKILIWGCIVAYCNIKYEIFDFQNFYPQYSYEEYAVY
jgi:hypothetical protein